jgi:phage terminase large subunit-like protein
MKSTVINRKCSGCDSETPDYMAIDNWCIVDGKFYCRGCQKIKNIGWYEKTINKIPLDNRSGRV